MIITMIILEIYKENYVDVNDTLREKGSIFVTVIAW